MKENYFFPNFRGTRDFTFLYDHGCKEVLKNVNYISIQSPEVVSILTFSLSKNTFNWQNLGSRWEFLSSLFCYDLPNHRPSFEEKIVDVVGQLADLAFSGENRPKINIGHNFFLRARRDHVVT